MNCFIFFICILLFVVHLGCAPGNCRRDGRMIAPTAAKSIVIDEEDNRYPPQSLKEKKSLHSGESSLSDRISVYKYNGTVQCAKSVGVSIEKMAKQLNGIKIYSQYTRSDGLFHVQVCGANSGMVNVYEIHKNDLEKAQKAGFILSNP